MSLFHGWCNELLWRDVNPASHLFDRDTFRTQLEVAARTTELRTPIDQRVVFELLGVWAAGWTWCRDRLRRDRPPLAPKEKSPIDVIVASVSEWRAFLESLAALMKTLPVRVTHPLAFADSEEREDAERRDVTEATTQLTSLALQFTGANGSQWTAPLEWSLLWFLDVYGYRRALFEPHVHRALSDRYEANVVPSQEVIREQSAWMGDRVARESSNTPYFEADPARILDQWGTLREGWSGHAPMFVHTPVQADGHRVYVATLDRKRNPITADRLEVAIDACREWALSSSSSSSSSDPKPLTFDDLAAWQGIALGLKEPAPFESPVVPQDDFDVYLGESSSTTGSHGSSLPCASRAACAYFDVTFFQPFKQLNHFAARLALDAILTREGFALHVAEPLFAPSRSLENQEAISGTVMLLDLLMGQMVER